jgi:serine/threonine protein kinase
MVGLVHSDLKPENILLDIDHINKKVKSVKIIDFGSSFNF